MQSGMLVLTRVGLTSVGLTSVGLTSVVTWCGMLSKLVLVGQHARPTSVGLRSGMLS